MKNLIILIGFLVVGVLSKAQDTVMIQKKIEAAVIEWADQKFVAYDNPRFEKLMIFYSDAYEMWKMRPAMLKSRKKKIKAAHAKGESGLSDEEYQKQLDEIDEQLKNVQERISSMTAIADKFMISFWANIKTNDGITVHYEHIMTLDGQYNVLKGEENSSIGKKSDETKILYK